MANCMGATEKTGDLFDTMPIPRGEAVQKPSLAPALTTARVLCRQLRRRQPRPDKQRIAHLICLNLLSMLTHNAQRARVSRSR